MLARISAVVLALALAPIPDARGESKREQAAALLREGVRLHDAGDHAAALERYAGAQRLYPSYKLHYNIGLTLEAMGRLEEAAAHLEQFLRQAFEADSERTVAARAKLQALVSKLGVVSVRCPVRGAAVAVDGKVVGRTPLEHRIYLRPGRYRLTIDAPGQAQLVREIAPVPGATLEVSMVPIQPAVVPAQPTSPPAVARATSEPAPAAPPPRPTPLYRKWWFWTIVGAVVVGGTVAAVVATQGGDSWQPSGEKGFPKWSLR